MIPLSTAKLLLFIAVLMGPKGGDTIQIVNHDKSVVWAQDSSNWKLVEQEPASATGTNNGIHVADSDLNRTKDTDFQAAREITSHNWNKESVLYLQNGNKVEKQGNKIFYTTNPGGYNQEIYTILTIANGKTL